MSRIFLPLPPLTALLASTVLAVTISPTHLGTSQEGSPVEPVILTPTWSSLGTQVSEALGTSVAVPGDVNNDGFDDIIVGAPGYDDPSNPLPDEGAAFLFLGSASGVETTAVWSAFGIEKGFGAAVASAGDVNGDGFGDVIVGEPAALSVVGGANLGLGQIYVFFGSATGLSLVPDWTSTGGVDNALGSAVASAGDVNGDGFDEVIASGSVLGVVYVYYGSASGPSLTADWTVAEPNLISHFGESLGSAGDVNGDGFDDVIIGEPGYEEVSLGAPGRVQVYLGSAGGLALTPDWELTGEGDCPDFNPCSFGASVGTAGDLNNDLYDDVIIGDDSTEVAYVYLGSAGGLAITPAWTALPPGPSGTAFGASVSAAGCRRAAGEPWAGGRGPCVRVSGDVWRIERFTGLEHRGRPSWGAPRDSGRHGGRSRWGLDGQRDHWSASLR